MAPIGIIANVLAVAVGGVLGALLGNRLSDRLKSTLNMIFGICAMGMGVSSIVLMENMPAVIFAVIIGTTIGVALHLGDRINRAASGMQRLVGKHVRPPKSGLSEDEYNAMLLTVIVLFCASGTGIYGSLISGISGDHSVLLAKSILDLFTAMIFACSLGIVVSFIAVPQLIIFLALFFLARVIYPLCSPSMINDFKACGGIILLATGFRILKVKDFPIADMIPAMLLVMPLSWLWTQFIVPLM